VEIRGKFQAAGPDEPRSLNPAPGSNGLKAIRRMQVSPEVLRQCWFLAGPTAAGKSAAGLELAEMLGAEIVSLDSMTLYRGMEIGTAKPSPADRSRIPHHLLDVVDPHEEYSLAEYVQAADAVCRDILARGRVPLFVGGTGLYLRAVLRGVFDGPPADWEIRQRLAAVEETDGAGSLHRLLQTADPPTAALLHPHDTRRTIRALEVYELTGLPLSAQQQQRALPLGERPRHVYWLLPPRDWLHERIDLRVETMFAGGLVDEVRGLCAAPGGLGRTASQALGYKEVLDHLAGQATLPETMTRIQTRTRQFAKRQHTWFRNLEECTALEVTPALSATEIARQLFSFGGR
jgi:tRNA dimethylallyltransferase